MLSTGVAPVPLFANWGGKLLVQLISTQRINFQSYDESAQPGDLADEEKIWREFLQIIANIENPQLIYHGSYETVFQRFLKKRYGDTTEDGRSVLHRLMECAQNVLSVIYGRVYLRW